MHTTRKGDRHKGEGGIFGVRAKIYSFMVKRSGFMEALYEKVAEDVKSEFENTGKKSISVLDVGTGPGIIMRKIKEKLGDKVRIYGVDVSEDMVRIAERNVPDAEIKVGMAENIPFEDNMFDIVISVLSAHHWDDVQKGIEEIKRVLKKNGKGIIWEVNPKSGLKDIIPRKISITKLPFALFHVAMLSVFIKNGHFRKVEEIINMAEKEEKDEITKQNKIQIEKIPPLLRIVVRK